MYTWAVRPCTSYWLARYGGLARSGLDRAGCVYLGGAAVHLVLALARGHVPALHQAVRIRRQDLVCVGLTGRRAAGGGRRWMRDV